MPAVLKPSPLARERVHVFRPEASERSAFQELSVVALLVPATTFDGEPVGVGATGTIVSVWNDGEAYDVEFTDPVGIASVAAADIRLA